MGRANLIPLITYTYLLKYFKVKSIWIISSEPSGSVGIYYKIMQYVEHFLMRKMGFLTFPILLFLLSGCAPSE